MLWASGSFIFARISVAACYDRHARTSSEGTHRPVFTTCFPVILCDEAMLKEFCRRCFCSISTDNSLG